LQEDNNFISISMASVRQLKKDIDNQLFEIISDCLLFVGLHSDKKTDEISSIIEDSVSLRNDLIARVNNPDGKDDPKIVRKHYQLIVSDLNTGVDQLCSRLSALSSKKKK
jgi:hypothetical protein